MLLTQPKHAHAVAYLRLGDRDFLSHAKAALTALSERCKKGTLLICADGEFAVTERRLRQLAVMIWTGANAPRVKLCYPHAGGAPGALEALGPVDHVFCDADARDDLAPSSLPITVL